MLPRVQQAFRINVTGPDNLGILGSSLGGLISCYAGFTRPTVYGRAGCMSSSFWWNNEDFNNVILRKHGRVPVTFYLDSGNAGTDNDDETQTITVRNHFASLGYTLDEDLFYYLGMRRRNICFVGAY